MCQSKPAFVFAATPERTTKSEQRFFTLCVWRTSANTDLQHEILLIPKNNKIIFTFQA
jgi:hypothetical protein